GIILCAATDVGSAIDLSTFIGTDLHSYINHILSAVSSALIGGAAYACAGIGFILAGRWPKVTPKLVGIGLFVLAFASFLTMIFEISINSAYSDISILSVLFFIFRHIAEIALFIIIGVLCLGRNKEKTAKIFTFILFGHSIAATSLFLNLFAAISMISSTESLRLISTPNTLSESRSGLILIIALLIYFTKKKAAEPTPAIQNS
ncbi:MAG: hypothetical protein J6L81_10525, partial [Clostridia bacterium]|nr:hypothetical protein [Clostridia bacterium]